MHWRSRWVKKKRNLTVKAELNAKHVWGKIITYLREHHLSALHVACGDVSDVKIENGVLVISTDQDYLNSILNKEENREEINNAIKFFGFDLKFEIKLLGKPSAEVEADLQTLREYFGEELKIK